jgi:uncharacterized protein YjbI with pentapeptide repeats
MANEEHIEILRKGVKAWNEWRERRRDIKPDLSGVNFRCAELQNGIFSQTCLHRANFSQLILTEINLTKANLIKAKFEKSDLSEADFSNANLHKADFSNANFSEAGLTRTIKASSIMMFSVGVSTEIDNIKENSRELDFSFAELSGVDFRSANLTDADFSSTKLTRVKFSDADFTEAIFNESILYGVIFEDANLSEANFNGANLSRAGFNGATLTSAVLRKVNLRNTNLSRINLEKADLTEADLSQANFSGANLSQAILQGANLRRANLSPASFSESYPTDIERTEYNFVFAFLEGSSIDSPVAYFRKTNLSGSNLSGANLEEANLNQANLDRADLSQANLSRISALYTNFSQAIFTGVCIRDWHINRLTKLDGVICDYVYLMQGQQELRPYSRNFKPGEFSKLYETALETVDIVFLDGIDWKAFLVSFLELKAETGSDEISIQSFENRNGAFIARINVPPDVDKAYVERFIEEKYQLALKAKDEEIGFLREEIAYKRRENTNLIGIIGTMAEKENYKNYFHQPQIGNFIDTAQSGSRQQSINNQHNYASEQKQTLAEAAAEIQKLLQQLEQANPSASESDKLAYVNDETTSSFKRRVVGALQATGEAAIDEFVLENKYLKVVKAAIKGWMKPE